MSDRKYARFGGGTANLNENNHIAKKTTKKLVKSNGKSISRKKIFNIFHKN